ncbi:unnamed protein product [Heterobilharzia americana]|nr:unnamed protein product [Heterobilharzia americana]
MLSISLICLLTVIVSPHIRCEVFELDNRFVDFIERGPWLVQFYAPWCGFCRRLASTYEEASKLLFHLEPSIKVARLDATVYTGIAKMFDVRGFPTIKYINGTVTYTFMGDRTVKGLVTFAQRANGPAVKHFDESYEFEKRIKQLSLDEPFFFLLDSTSSTLQKETFLEVAEQLRVFSWFFSGPMSVLTHPYSELLKSSSSIYTEILVFKDSNIYSYPGLLSNENLQIANNKSELYQDLLLCSDWWQFASDELLNNNQDNSNISVQSTYPISYASPLHSYRNYRLLGLFTVDQVSEDSFPSRVLKFGENLALKRLSHIIRYFQLAWTNDLETLEDLAMGSIITPNFIVLDPVTRELFLYLSNHYSSNSLLLDESNLINFLMLVNDGKVKAVGGNTILIRLQRLGYNFIISFSKFLLNRPLMSLLILGVPIIMFSGIIYLCCCLDTNYSMSNDNYIDFDKHIKINNYVINKNIKYLSNENSTEIDHSTNTLIHTNSCYINTDMNSINNIIRFRNIHTTCSPPLLNRLHGKKTQSIGPVYSEEELKQRIQDSREKRKK